jgi:hypothetical protein
MSAKRKASINTTARIKICDRVILDSSLSMSLNSDLRRYGKKFLRGDILLLSTIWVTGFRMRAVFYQIRVANALSFT